MAPTTSADQLHACCQMTGAAWALELERELPYGGVQGTAPNGASTPAWVMVDSSGLRQANLKTMLNLVNAPPLQRWLADAAQTGRSRSRRAAKASADALFFHAFPAGTGESNHRAHSIRAADAPATVLLLIGGGRLTAQARRIWRLAALAASQGQRRALLEQELQNTRQELQARIAAQAAAEQRLIQAAKLAAVGEMAAGVAHELNNPLTAIVGFSEILLEDMPEGSGSRSDLETVLREALRARDVVRRLLDFSRRSEMVRSKADVNAIVHDTLGLVRHLLNTGGVEVRTSLDNSLPWISVDRDQIKQVLLNLLHNALSAMPHGGTVDIKTSLREKYATDWITIAVEDSGVGIPPENMERIFEPFFTTRAREGGTGLGLAVTYGIVSSHGGMIEAESAPGAGAVFTVWLPVVEKSQ